jgi:hypothetical protein
LANSDVSHETFNKLSQLKFACGARIRCLKRTKWERLFACLGPSVPLLRDWGNVPNSVLLGSRPGVPSGRDRTVIRRSLAFTAPSVASGLRDHNASILSL